MPTTLPRRRPIRRDRRLELALLGVLAAEVVTLGAAAACMDVEAGGRPRWLTASIAGTCTVVEAPCHLLAP